MVTENAKTYVKEPKCNSCENINLCKFSDDMKQMCEKLSSLKLNYNKHPFDINVNCHYYKEKKMTKGVEL
jgi:hypothetical protein